MPHHRSLAVLVSRRIYRWLLRAYPRSYWCEWAGPMEQLFADCAKDAFDRSAHLGLSALWCRTLWDYAISLECEYRRQARGWAGRVAARPRKQWHNFTPRAGNALALARKAAQRLGHDFVGTEHLLLGIIGQSDNVGVRILKDLNVDLPALTAAIERDVIRGASDHRDGGSIPFTPYVKRILGFAAKEARDLGHSYLGCEHMLVGLVRQRGVAHDVLTEFGVTAERCIDKIRMIHQVGVGRFSLPKIVRPEEDHGVTPIGLECWTVEVDGRFIRRNSTESIFGQVTLVLCLSRTGTSLIQPKVTFEVTANELPIEQWLVVEQSILDWWRRNASAFGSWQLDIQIVGATWQPAATPAYDRAAVVALNDAIVRAIAAGVLPKLNEEN